MRCAFLANFVFATRIIGLNIRTLRDMDVQLIPKMKRQNQCTNCTIQKKCSFVDFVFFENNSLEITRYYDTCIWCNSISFVYVGVSLHIYMYK